MAGLSTTNGSYNVASGTSISRAEEEGGVYNHVDPLTTGEYAVYDVSGQLKAQLYSGIPATPTGAPVDVSGILSYLPGKIYTLEEVHQGLASTPQSIVINLQDVDEAPVIDSITGVNFINPSVPEVIIY